MRCSVRSHPSHPHPSRPTKAFCGYLSFNYWENMVGKSIMARHYLGQMDCIIRQDRQGPESPGHE